MVVSTENIVKSNSSDIKATLSNIKKYDMEYVGVKADLDAKDYYILEKDGIKVAILAYVGEDYEKSNKNGLINIYSADNLERDLKKIRKEKVDATILFIDTLKSGISNPSKDKKQLLQSILNKNIDVIISNDSVIQKNYKDSKGYIEYSLGNFIGEQENEDSDISKLLKVTIMREDKTNTKIKTEYDKTFVALSNLDKSKYKIVDLKKELDGYNENVQGSITKAEHEYLLKIGSKISD